MSAVVGPLRRVWFNDGMTDLSVGVATAVVVQESRPATLAPRYPYYDIEVPF